MVCVKGQGRREAGGCTQEGKLQCLLLVCAARSSEWLQKVLVFGSRLSQRVKWDIWLVYAKVCNLDMWAVCCCRLIHAGLVQARQVMLDALSALLTQQPAPSPSSTTPAASPSPAAAAQVQGAFAVVKQWAQQLWLQAQQRVSLLAGLAGKASPGVTTTLVPGDLVATARKLLGQGWTAAGAHSRLHRTAEPEASASDMGVPSDADIPASVMRQQLDADTSQPTQLKEGLQLAYCKYLNASSCQASVDWSSTATAKFARHQQPSNTEEPSAVGVADDPPDQLLVVVYNPLSWPRREGVRVPLGRGLGNLEVTGG